MRDGEGQAVIMGDAQAEAGAIRDHGSRDVLDPCERGARDRRADRIEHAARVGPAGVDEVGDLLECRAGRNNDLAQILGAGSRVRCIGVAEAEHGRGADEARTQDVGVKIVLGQPIDE